ncbi:helix-turn-helix domain-containing protein [Streptomyces sp. NPDC088789]|uniref:helix-turn-helix domain-containing protein n=1 Tax=Streptomyces sp. NPDC088789 TaxID=3365899 RepID=UPI003801502A
MPHRRVVSGRSQEPRRRFAEELRLLRAQKRVTFRELGERLGWDRSQFAKMESGETLGGPEVVEALEQFYDTTPGLLLALWELAVSDPTQFRERYRRYMTLEAEAVGLWKYSVSLPPGLLQTAGFIHASLAAGGLKGKDLEQQVGARLGRRKLLESDPPPPFRVILSEAVLRNAPRDAEPWREQLEYLAEAGEQPNITIHVLPFGTGLHGLINTDVMFLRLADGSTVAYTENDVGGELIEETSRVENLHRIYDAVRDQALTPAESRTFILRMLEEAPCERSI